MKIAWIAPKWPLPARDGARRATLSLMGGLSRLGFEISLISISSDHISQEDQSLLCDLYALRECHVLPRAKGLMAKLCALRNLQLPITVAPYRAAGPDIGRILQCGGFDLVMYDGLHGAAHRLDLPAELSEQIPYVYRAHNCESELWRQRHANLRGPMRSIFSWQSKLMRSFESEIVRGASGVFPVSSEDAKMLGVDPASVVPIGVEFPRLETAPRQLCELLFVGRLDWLPNREGLSWFLEAVWPTLRSLRPDARLTIVGSGAAGWLAPFRGDERVSILGEVPDIAPLLRRATISLAPLRSGSGTRVKIIEASSFGCATISTTLGYSGLPLTPGRDVLDASSATEWIRQLAELTEPEATAIGAAAWTALRQRFETDACALRCSQLLDGFSRASGLQPLSALNCKRRRAA